MVTDNDETTCWTIEILNVKDLNRKVKYNVQAFGPIRYSAFVYTILLVREPEMKNNLSLFQKHVHLSAVYFTEFVLINPHFITNRGGCTSLYIPSIRSTVELHWLEHCTVVSNSFLSPLEKITRLQIWDN